MNDRIRTLVYVAVALIVVAALIGSYMYTSRNKSISELEQESGGLKTYVNEIYGISFKYPEDWRIQDEEIRAVKNPAEGFDSGVAYLSVVGTDEATGNDAKVEIFLVPATQTIETFKNEQEGVKAETHNGIEWFVERKNSSTPSESLQALGITETNYAGVSTKNTIVIVTGFSFEGEESSVYSEEVERILRQIVSTLSFG